MIPVASPNKLGKGIAHFVGKNIDESIALAEAWAKRNGVTLVNYYLQFNGRSILVDSIKALDEELSPNS